MLQKIHEQLVNSKNFDMLVTNDVSLVSSDNEKDILVDTADDVTITLPEITDVNLRFYFHNYGAGKLVVSSSNSQSIMNDGDTNIETANSEQITSVSLEGVSANKKWYIREGVGFYNTY